MIIPTHNSVFELHELACSNQIARLDTFSIVLSDLFVDKWFVKEGIKLSLSCRETVTQEAENYMDSTDYYRWSIPSKLNGKFEFLSFLWMVSYWKKGFPYKILGFPWLWSEDRRRSRSRRRRSRLDLTTGEELTTSDGWKNGGFYSVDGNCFS